MASFCAHVLVTQHSRLPRDYFSGGWCLSVRMYLPITQNIRLPRDYFFRWCLSVRMFLSITQNIRLPRDYYFWGCFFQSRLRMYNVVIVRASQLYITTLAENYVLQQGG